MGTLLYFPKPVLSSSSYPQFIPDPPLDRDALKTLFTSSIQGVSPVSATNKAVRRPFAGEIIDVTSPTDPNTIFGLKKVGVAENIQRQNLNSKIRYIMTDDTGEAASERDFPMGDLQLKTLMLSLVEWNLIDDQERPIPLNENTVQTYLSPREFSFLYSKVLELNPIWSGGEEETKNA